MNESRRISLLVAALLAVLLPWSRAQAVEVGQTAPELGLMDQNGETHRVDQYAGRWLVVYFYPKNDTPGCTTEACEFRDDVFQLQKMDVALLGVSTDEVDSHKAFAAKYHLPFPLLSDASGAVAESYGSLFSLGPLKFAKRHTFIIGPDGRVAKVYRKVDPKSHSDQVIADLKTLMGA